MLRSMTGFARGSARGDWGELTCELRSVNHRFLDIAMRLPDELRPFEPEIRDEISQQLTRGKVDCSVKLKLNEAAVGSEIDKAQLHWLSDALRQVNAESNAAAPNPVEILKWPGVLRQGKADEAVLRTGLIDALTEAVAGMVKMRAGEGERLATAIQPRLQQLADAREVLATAMPELREAVRTRLTRKIADLDIEADPARLEQELVLQSQKMDIDEELDRLSSHLVAIDEALQSDEPVGRRLDFLIQECHREANTIGSKSQSTSVSQTSVEMKVAIEQIREQVQNIE